MQLLCYFKHLVLKVSINTFDNPTPDLGFMSRREWIEDFIFPGWCLSGTLLWLVEVVPAAPEEDYRHCLGLDKKLLCTNHWRVNIHKIHLSPIRRRVSINTNVGTKGRKRHLSSSSPLQGSRNWVTRQNGSREKGIWEKMKKNWWRKQKMNSESESVALRGATRCGAALCSPRSRWERIFVSYPVHQLSLKPGGLLSDTTLTDSSLQCSVIARISFCRRI